MNLPGNTFIFNVFFIECGPIAMYDCCIRIWTSCLNIFIFNMLFFSMFESSLYYFCYCWYFQALSLSRTRGLKSPNSYEIAYDKYRESLSCPHPPCTIISCIGDLTGWQYDDMKNDHIANTTLHTIYFSISKKNCVVFWTKNVYLEGKYGFIWMLTSTWKFL